MPMPNKLPGWLWVVIASTVTTFLQLMLTGIEENLVGAFTPVIVAVVMAALKGWQTWSKNPPEFVERSTEPPSKLREFLWGE